MKIRPGKMCVDHTIKTAKFISSETALPKRNARDENSQPFSIRKICWLTPKWRKSDFKSLIKGLK